jgi:excisionase family DNA binding protein
MALSNKSISTGVHNMEESLLRSDEVAEILKVSVSMAYTLMRRGDIPTVRIGSSVRVRKEDLDRYIQENVSQTAPLLRGKHRK